MCKARNLLEKIYREPRTTGNETYARRLRRRFYRIQASFDRAKGDMVEARFMEKMAKSLY